MKESESQIEALDGIAGALREVADALRALGNGNASTPMGAIEAFGLYLHEEGIRILKDDE